MAQYSDTSVPLEQAVTHGSVAALAAVGAAWIGWQMGWPWVFDIDDPDFNPMLIALGLLAGTALVFSVRAVLWAVRAARFGATDIELDGRIPVPLGGPLNGRLRFSRPLAPCGDWTLELTCLDIHETHDIRATATGPYQRDAYPVWRERITLPGGEEAVEHLSFHFDLPQSVGPAPVAPLKRKNAYFRFTASVNIPGLRRVFSHNAPPVARTWSLSVRAPMAETEYRADFPIPVEI